MKRKLTATFAFLLLLTSGAWAAADMLRNFGSSKSNGGSPYTNSLISDQKESLFVDGQSQAPEGAAQKASIADADVTPPRGLAQPTIFRVPHPSAFCLGGFGL